MAPAEAGKLRINTAPAPVSPTAAVQYYDLELPPGLEIRSVGYGATTFTEVSGTDGPTSSAVGGRAFLRVYAVHRATGSTICSCTRTSNIADGPCRSSGSCPGRTAHARIRFAEAVQVPVAMMSP
jgi:hypothetical protein